MFTTSEKEWTKVLKCRPNVESFLDRQANLNQRRLRGKHLENSYQARNCGNAQDRRLRSLDASKYIDQRNSELFRSEEKNLNFKTEFLPHLKLRFKKRTFNAGKIEMVAIKSPGIPVPDPNIEIKNFIESTLPNSPEPTLARPFGSGSRRGSLGNPLGPLIVNHDKIP